MSEPNRLKFSTASGSLMALVWGGDPSLPKFLEWIAARLVRKGDDENVDFVLALRRYAKSFNELKINDYRHLKPDAAPSMISEEEVEQIISDTHVSPIVARILRKFHKQLSERTTGLGDPPREREVNAGSDRLTMPTAGQSGSSPISGDITKESDNDARRCLAKEAMLLEAEVERLTQAMILTKAELTTTGTILDGAVHQLKGMSAVVEAARRYGNSGRGYIEYCALKAALARLDGGG